MKKIRKYLPQRKYLLISFPNALVFFVLLFLTQKVYFLSDVEAEIFSKLYLAFEIFFEEDDTDIKEELLLVNTSYDNEIGYFIQGKDTIGNIPITNRKHLAKFLNYLKREQNHQFVICDILFDQESKYDSVLNDALKQSKLIIPEPTKETSYLNYDSILVGSSVVYTSRDQFYKYRLIDSSATIPAKMFEQLHNVTIQKKLLWNTSNGKRMLNDFVPDFRLTEREINSLNIQQLQDMVEIPDVFLKNITEGKIIVIGDFFVKDNKNTVAGNMPGSLIMLNAYYSIKKGNAYLSGILLVYLFLSLWVVSYFIVIPQNNLELAIRSIPFLGGYLLLSSHLLIMTLFSYLTYLIFDIKLSLSLLAFLLYAENIVISLKFYLKKWGKHIVQIYQSIVGFLKAIISLKEK